MIINPLHWQRRIQPRKACLVYFRDANVPVLPALVERDAEKLARMREFHQRLKQLSVAFLRERGLPTPGWL